MDLLQLGNKIFVMSPKIPKDPRIGVFLEKLPDEFTGENDAVSNGRGRTASAQRMPLLPKLAFEVGKQVISKTEHLDNKIIKTRTSG